MQSVTVHVPERQNANHEQMDQIIGRCRIKHTRPARLRRIAPHTPQRQMKPSALPLAK